MLKGACRKILKTRIFFRLPLATVLSLLLGWLVFGSPFLVHADALIIVEPITWNVIGLDSNNVDTGPENFPVGARVCNPISSITSVNNVSADFVWLSANSYIDLRVGSLDPISPGVNLAPGDCFDFYFEVTLTRDSDAYDTTRQYRIDASGTDSVSGAPITASTPTPREIYIEYLISQSRNSTMDVKLGTDSIPPGGTMALVLGETYTIELVGKTATNGYEQIESYINFPNTIFQINSVTTTYSADSGTDPLAATKLYADGCDWENDPNSPNYRSCLSTGKYGGNVSVMYDVTIIGGAGTTQILNTLIYDFSGSSYHYNSDFSVAGRIAAIVDPALITISKNFTPNPSNVDGATTLTFTLNNPNGVAISGANFTDTFPNSPDDMVVADPTGATTSGCGAPTFVPVAGAGSISFSDGTIAANGICTVSVLVTAPAAGTYLNTSDNLFIDTMDTGNFASDSLVVNTNPGPPPCTPNLELATWIMDPSQGTVTIPPNPWFVAGNVATAQAFQGSGITSSIDTTGNPANSWEAHGFARTTFDLADNDYFQFNIDTSNFTQIDLALDARRSTPGPSIIYLYYSTTGTEPYTPIGLPDPFAVSTSWGNISQAFAAASTTGTTFFRIYGFSANNQQSGANLFLDNIIFTGCGVAVPPSIIKSFSPNPIAVNGTSTLTFTLTNPNSAPLTGVAFTDDYPSGVVNDTPALGTTTCGAGIVTAADGGGSVSLSGGTIAANTTCTVTVDVTATTSGPHTNVSGYVSSTESGTNTGPDGSAIATLTALTPPVISKQFAPNPILINGTSTLSFTITNPNPNDQLTGVAFLDTYPLNVVNAGAPATSNTCGGLVTAVASGGSIDFAGGTIAGGGICTVQVDVTSDTVGSYVNTSGNVSADVVGAGNTASDTLLVEPVRPALSLLKQVSTSATGPWTTFIAVDAGDDIYYQFTVENTGDVPLSPVSVADPTLAGTAADPAACVWPDPLPVAVAINEDHIATCVPAVAISAVVGSHPNTATAQGTYSGTVYTSFPSDAEYATTGLTLAKSVAESTFLAAGDVLHYRYLVTNSGFAPLGGLLTISDNKATDETCPALETVGDFDAFLDPGESITCTATYTVLAGEVTAGSVTNIASATIDGMTSNTDSETVTYLAPPTVTKVFLPATINVGITSTLTITLSNPGNTDYTGLAFTDTYPVEIYNASPTNVSTTCQNGLASATAGAGSVSLSGASLLAGASCTLSVDVTSVTPGAHLNTIPIGGVTTDQSVSNTVAAGDTLTVTVATPTVTKVFAPDTIAAGGTSTVTITLGNTNAVAATLSANFDDDLPAGVTAQAVNGATTCPGAVDISTNTRIRYPSGASIPAGGCGIAVDVTSLVLGTHTNTIGAGDLQTDFGNNAAAASDDLTVMILAPSMGKNFAPDPIAEGGVSTLTFTLDNPNLGVALTGVAFADTFPLAPGSMVVAAAPNESTTNCGTPTFTPLAGAGTISFSGGTILAGGTCTVTVDVTAPVAGIYANTSGAVSSTNGGVGNTAGDTLTVSFAAPTITKAFGTDPIAVGGTSTITLTITNPNLVALTGAGVTDTYPAAIFNETPANGATSCVGGVVTAVDGGGSVALSGGTIPASGSCTVTVDVTSSTPGTHTNMTGVVTTNEAPASGTASDDLTVTAVSPTVTKVFAPDTIAAGGTSTLTITLGNSNAVAATLSANFDDDLPAGVTAQAVNGATTCPGAVDISTNTRIRYASGASIPAGGCDIAVDVTSSTPGTVTNTIGVGDLQTDLGNNAAGTSDDLTVLGSSSATISKTFVDTNQPHTTASEVAIGEILTYEVEIILSSGIMNVAVLSDFLDRGLAFVNCESISAPPTLTTTVGGGFPWICSNPQVDAFPSTSTAPVDQGRNVSFDFETLTNTSGGNVSLTVRYRVAVLNSAGNISGVQLDNLAYWQWTGGMISDASNSVVIVEPELSLQKTANPTLVTPGTTITYTHTVSHTAASDTAAFDVKLTDDLPTPLSYVAGTQDCNLGTQNPNICSFNPALNELTVEWTAASGFTAAGGFGMVELDTLLGNVSPGSSFTNTSTLEWSSLPGDFFTPQSLYNTLSTERYYDPPDPVDIYGVEASATIRTPGASTDWLPATGFTPGVVTQIPPEPQGYLFTAYGDLEIEIPSINLRRSIIGIPFGEDSWQLDWLWDQTGYLEGTSFPTWSGNTVITAHVYLPNGLPGPFVRLGELQWGDQVVLHAFGRQYFYEVREVRNDLPSDPAALGHEELDWVTLITCINYDSLNDSYRQRLIVRAVLVRIE